MRRTLRFLLLGLLAGLVAGCAPDPPLRVAVHPWIGYETLYLAHDFGWLPDGIIFAEGQQLSDSAAALRAGHVDAAALTLDEVLLLREQGVPATVVMVFDISAGADALLVRPDITRLPDLRGRRVAVEPSALGPLILHHVLTTAGLEAGEVIRVDSDIDRQPRAWAGGEIDAAITYGPTIEALERLGAVRLFDSRQMPDTILDVLAVRADRVGDRRLAGLIEAHFRGLAHLRRNREDAMYRIAGRLDVTVSTVERDLAGVSFPDEARNLAMLGPGSQVEQAARIVGGVMREQGLLKRAVDLDGLVDDRAMLALSDPTR
jgi:NitT/TauT family transport system substrate-binding protein